jgi:hypothetical protein
VAELEEPHFILMRLELMEREQGEIFHRALMVGIEARPIRSVMIPTFFDLIILQPA